MLLPLKLILQNSGKWKPASSRPAFVICGHDLTSKYCRDVHLPTMMPIPATVIFGQLLIFKIIKSLPYTIYQMLHSQCHHHHLLFPFTLTHHKVKPPLSILPPLLHHKPTILHSVSASAIPPWLAQLADAAADIDFETEGEGPVELPFYSTLLFHLFLFSAIFSLFILS